MPARRPRRDRRSGSRRSAASLTAMLLAVGLISAGGTAAAATPEPTESTESVESEDRESVAPTPDSTEDSPAPSPEETGIEESRSPSPTEGDSDGSSSPDPAEDEADEPESAEPEETQEPTTEPSDSEARAEPEDSEDSSEEDEDLATPMEVPEPEDREAVINVNVGGDRTGDTSVGSLAGVTLQLHDGGSGGPGDPVNEDWATCESDADGDCSFTIPETQSGGIIGGTGENRDRRFWVVAESAPDGWQLNPGLVTGGTTSQSVTDYAFRTGYSTILGADRGVRAGNTYQSGDDFMTVSSGWGTNTVDSGGVWQASRANPGLVETCDAGLDVALILDLSGSVANDGALGDLQEASKDMTDALAGTGSALALYTFATTAPRNNTPGGQNYDLMPIDEGNNLQTIKDRIDAYQAEGGTNWDRGIYQAAQSSANYDLAVVVTDGLPTFYGPGGNPSGPGSSTRLVEAEQAIFSANALKSQGTRTLAVGVGAGVSGNPANLSAISGPNGYAGQQAHQADYFQEDWSRLADLLEEIALGATCQASVDIMKEAIAFDEGSPSSGGAGWEFTASTTQGQLSPESSQTTDDDGQVHYDLHFDTPSPEPAQLTIEEILSSEQEADGWSLEDITCTINGQDVPVGEAAADLTVTVGDDVDCTFLNVQHLVPEVSIEKQAWDTPDAGGLDGAEEIAGGSLVTDGSTITWTYTVTNTGETVLEDVQVTDDQLDPDAVDCPQSSLDPDESMTCTASGAVTAVP